MTTSEMPPAFVHGFPLRENCDPNNPYQFALWALVAMPGQNGGQLVMPVQYLQLVSKRLWDLGFRQVEPPKLKYRKPSATEPHWMTSPGRWVDVNDPDADPRPPARQAVDSITITQRAELFAELYKNHTPRERFLLMQKITAEYEAAQAQAAGDDEAAALIEETYRRALAAAKGVEQQ